ncbi:MAG: cardiolipin synthase [Synergistaceae bacterium]|jgi:cardiolipin synthase|nr:cardiolipin synthase [Synergistaceae bacterium]
MRFSLRSVLFWSVFLVTFLLCVQFVAGLRQSPILWGSDGISLSRELWGHIHAMGGSLKRYVYWILGFYALLAGLVIFLEEQNPDRALIWLGALLLFPFVGLAAYVICGPNARSVGHRWRVRKTARSRPRGVGGDAASNAVCGLERLLSASCGSVPTTRNSVKILLDGDNTFRAIEKALSNAEKYIHMEYFSIASDELGQKIGNLLLAKASSGVTVRLLYDAVGSWRMGRSYIETLRGAGVEIHPFMPTAFARFRSGLNHRDHRKILVVDGRVGFLGGLNIGDMYMGKDPKMGYWRDTHLQISGEALPELNRVFLAHWGECTGKYMDYRQCGCVPPGDMETTPVQIATSGPGRDFRAIACGYFHMIASARRRVWITTPYLVPDASICDALCISAGSGIDVRIIIPSKPDHTLVFWASQFSVDRLLRSGVRVFSYQNGFIHAKTVVVDGEIASVGTANLDVRSLEVNYEIQAFIRSESVAEELESAFLDDLEKCAEETPADRHRRPFYKKCQASIGRLWSSLL